MLTSQVVAAQLKACLPPGSPSQTFSLANYDAQGFPDNFPVRTLPSAPGGGELCLQPQIVRTPHFSAVAFKTPEEVISLVVMNVGDHAVDFTLVDQAAKTGIRRLSMPPHAVHTYRWSPGTSPAFIGAEQVLVTTERPTVAAAPQRRHIPVAGVSMGLVLGLFAVVAAIGVTLYGSILGRGGRELKSVAAKWEACETAEDYDADYTPFPSTPARQD